MRAPPHRRCNTRWMCERGAQAVMTPAACKFMAKCCPSVVRSSCQVVRVTRLTGKTPTAAAPTRAHSLITPHSTQSGTLHHSKQLAKHTATHAFRLSHSRKKTHGWVAACDVCGVWALAVGASGRWASVLVFQTIVDGAGAVAWDAHRPPRRALVGDGWHPATWRRQPGLGAASDARGGPLFGPASVAAGAACRAAGLPGR
jgi:hypothetical protein